VPKQFHTRVETILDGGQDDVSSQGSVCATRQGSEQMGGDVAQEGVDPIVEVGKKSPRAEFLEFGKRLNALMELRGISANDISIQVSQMASDSAEPVDSRIRDEVNKQIENVRGACGAIVAVTN
jgi:hypothetical protein